MLSNANVSETRTVANEAVAKNTAVKRRVKLMSEAYGDGWREDGSQVASSES